MISADMVSVTITESAIRTGSAPAVGPRPNGSGRRTATQRSQVRAITFTVSPAVVIGLLAVLLTQVAGAVEALRTMAHAPAVMVAPLVVAVVALARLWMPVPGPQIHDRQLDLIISLGAGLTTCVLVVAQMTESGHDLGLLALAPTSVAVLAAVVGTRVLWHLRAVPALLALAWPAPWETALAPFGPESPARGALLIVVAVVAVAIALICGRIPSASRIGRRALSLSPAHP